MDSTQAMPLDGAIHPLAALLRGFAVDFLTAHDPGVVTRIMAPAYRLHIGGHVFDGRDDEYLPATAAQLEQFPGLCVTVHDVVIGADAIAMRFTEHGASVRDDGRMAAWSGVTLFRTDGERLLRGWAEEDYFARKWQLAKGACDAIEAPHPGPWDIREEAADPVAERIAREWLHDTRPVADVPDTQRVPPLDPHPSILVKIRDTHIDELFSAGERVAFHLEHRGSYAGGYDGVTAGAVGCPAVLRVAGLLTVRGGRVVDARLTADRLGLYRALLGRS